MRFSVCVTFTIHAQSIDDFIQCVSRQARKSLEIEPGCFVFDVWQNSKDSNVVFLYEIYQSAQAFSDHLDSAHYKAFDSVVASMVESKAVTTFDTELVVGAEDVG